MTFLKNGFMPKIKNSFHIMYLSFSLFIKEPRYFLFPLINVFLTAFLISTFLFTIYLTIGFDGLKQFFNKFDKDHRTANLGDYSAFVGVLFSVILIFNLFYTFISVAISSFSKDVFSNTPTGISKSFLHSLSKIWLILKWTLFSGVIGLILVILKKRGHWITNFFADLGRLAWGLAAFFMVPIIGLKNYGVIGSFNFSIKLMKKTFGESISALFVFGLIELFVFFVFPISSIFCYMLVHEYVFVPLGFLERAPFFLLMSPIVIVTVFLLATISTAKTIFKTAVFAYATGEPTGIFPKNLIKESFK